MTEGAVLGDGSLEERIEANFASLSPAEQKMASFFRTQKEAVLLNSAAEIAEKAGTSDATVVRAARSLGFDSLFSLREAILADLTATSPEGRLSRTLADVANTTGGALGHVLRAHQESIDAMTSPDFSSAFDRAIDILFSANRRFVFGIGPSGYVANYTALQFNRIGLSTVPLSDTGIGLADSLLGLRQGDAVMMIANAPIYREVSVILDYAEEHDVPVVLVGDTLGPFIRKRTAEILPTPRGKADHLAMHGATMVLVEAMIVAMADRDRSAALESLANFAELRGSIDKLWQKRGVRSNPKRK
ncbi:MULTISPECIES: MurR/RpiR family transcriptional regulator [unclassified Rhizobium]|uniref:MurR/RpiR family transcriptional regulator n=1 Tax=unclassified Rhizobium TaxID=2613769 RepID=UPI001051C39C|nr:MULTISPECIES: MurR/RpiR family transcriptional regulator [unclassified Rhizobium]MBB3397369.1 DNA-binding MurR/RpiR family transcriptional regulator [Rhizobium sp. BK060]MBB4171572.1 DNA-binding MurR/RpiR family transcriptional regulator [Rhizobium sp. BK538]